IVLRSNPPPAAPPPITLCRSAPPRPPPTIPAMEFPAVPRLFSFIAAPAMLPPTAPLTTSMIRLIMFMLIYLFVRIPCIRESAEKASRTCLTAAKTLKRINFHHPTRIRPSGDKKCPCGQGRASHYFDRFVAAALMSWFLRLYLRAEPACGEVPSRG